MNLRKRLLQFGVFACMISGGFSLNSAWGQVEPVENEAPAEKQTDEKTQEDGHAEKVQQFESFSEFRKFRVANMQAYSVRYRAAKSAEERSAVSKTMPTATPYLDQLERFIREGSTEEAAEVARWWMHGNRAKRDAHRVMDALMDAHVDAEFLTRYVPHCGRLLPAEKAETIFRTLIEKNNFDSVKASATYSLQALLDKQAKTIEGEKSKALTAEVKSLQETLKNDYPEMLDLTGVPFVTRIKGSRFARNIAIGKMAPDIVGKDLDGVEFKLSDYKGKVIVLDFWGHW